MPFVKEPHFCKPPLWPWLYRLGTVWQCHACKANYKVEKGHSYYDRHKRWTRL